MIQIVTTYIMRGFVDCMGNLLFKLDTFIYIVMAYGGCVVESS